MNDSHPNEILLYQSADGQHVEVQMRGDTLWLALSEMAELFGRDKSVISRHLRNVFKDGELERSAVVAKNATTAADGKTYQVEYFNLDCDFVRGLSGQFRTDKARVHGAPRQRRRGHQRKQQRGNQRFHGRFLDG